MKQKPGSPKLLIASLGFFGAICAMAADYPKDLFTVTELKFDAYRQACGLDCIVRDRSTKDVISSVAGTMGIHPGYVRLGLEIAYPSSRVEGEETYYTLPFPSGYKYCSANVNVVSLMSASSDPKRASLISVAIDAGTLGIYTWTGKPRGGEGQSSVEGFAKVTGIRPEYYDEFRRKGVCAVAPASGSREIMKCRGNPCNPIQDGGTDNVGSSTPELKKAPPGF